MTEYPPAVRLKDIKDRKGHLCAGGEFSLRDGPVCGCGAILDTVPDLLPPWRDDPPAPYGPDEPPHIEDQPDHPRMIEGPPNEEPPLLGGDGSLPAPFRHASGEPCYGCQTCFAERIDEDHRGHRTDVTDLLTEADAVEAHGREVAERHGAPDMNPAVPVIDPTQPYGPAEVERAILDSNRRLELGLKHEANLIAAAEQLKIEYELAYAKAVDTSRAGAADQRKANAVIATERQYRAWREAVGALTAMKSITHTLRSTVSALQSVSRSVGVSYTGPQGSGR